MLFNNFQTTKIQHFFSIKCNAAVSGLPALKMLSVWLALLPGKERGNSWVVVVFHEKLSAALLWLCP